MERDEALFTGESVKDPDQVKTELQSLAKSINGYVDVQRLFVRYGLERFFYRLSQTRHKDNFILKGAMIMPIYLGENHRSTKDADFSVRGKFNPEQLREICIECCQLEADDGLSFDVNGIEISDAGKDREYPGFDIKIPALLADSPCHINLDVSFGDQITPPPYEITYPTLLGDPAPELMVYPPEASIAEKFETIVSKGMSNTRVKDYFDLSEFAQGLVFRGDLLKHALERTFEFRSTGIPKEIPLALTQEYYNDKNRQSDWKQFIHNNSLSNGLNLAVCCNLIVEFLMPVADSITSKSEFQYAWRKGAWQAVKPKD